MKFASFETKGMSNTDEALAIAKANADDLGIKKIVVASTEGTTAKKAVELFSGDYEIIVITHNAWFREGTKCEVSDELRQELENAGAKVITATLAFSGCQSALQKKHGEWSSDYMFARLVRSIMADGLKVCMEIAIMACDNGVLSPGEEVITIAGTGRGADTVAWVAAAPSRTFMDLRVKAIFAKPQ